MRQALILLILLGVNLWASERDITVNIYNNGFSQITEKRTYDLTKGAQEVTIKDIARDIDPASIKVSGNFEVKTTGYHYDFMSSCRLMSKYIGQTITYSKDDSTASGELVNFDDDYIYLTDKAGMLYIFERKDFNYLKMPNLSEGLVIKPVIKALIDSKKAGQDNLYLSYLTEGLSWHAEYNLLYDRKKSADLSAWVNLKNECGVAFPEAEIVLIAGQVERVEATEGGAEQMESGAVADYHKSQLEPLVDYHRYKLPFNVGLNEMENKQALMFKRTDIDVEHYYKYEWSETKSDVKAMISFTNDGKSGLGIALPEGRMNIFDKGTGAFLGSGLFAGTPSGEKAEIYLGTAFDITAERKRFDHRKIGRNKNADSYEIVIRNAKDEKIKVIVAEEIYGYWEITESSDQFIKKDFQNVEFEVTINPHQEKVISYTVEYSY